MPDGNVQKLLSDIKLPIRFGDDEDHLVACLGPPFEAIRDWSTDTWLYFNIEEREPYILHCSMDVEVGVRCITLVKAVVEALDEALDEDEFPIATIRDPWALINRQKHTADMNNWVARTIVLMPDDGMTLWWQGVWDTRILDESELTLCDEMWELLGRYCAHFSELFNDYEECYEPLTLFEERLLDDFGLRVWRRLRLELSGQYRVIFYCHEFASKFGSPEELVTARRHADQR